jgi:acetylglutamate kinase
MNYSERAAVLSEALPYIQQFSGKTVVIKYGGNAMQNEEIKRAVLSDIVLLSLVGVRVAVVHGGGPEINAMLDRVGKVPRFVDGLRYTDAETMELVQMVLCGKTGKDLVSIIGELGGRAVGLSGLDGSMITAVQLQTGDYGLVGDIQSIDATPVTMALDNGYIPVVSTVARGVDANTSYNINADTAAAELAVALGAEKLILLTDIRGLCADPKDESTLIHLLSLSEVPALIKSGAVSGGMLPKVDCCVRAVRRGVPRVHILDGRIPHSILIEMLTDDAGVGTMMERD